LCIIDEFAADLDIFSRSRFFDYLTRECEMRGASVVYATHIFDQADSWASHITFMQLSKVLSPVHPLASYAPYQEILARTGAERAMCPMYVLVLEELERQYRAQSDVFMEDNQCLANVGDQTGWVSGRLTRQFAKEEEAKKRAKRVEQRIEQTRQQALL
jgi:ABC-type uncharacterized transport system ATPase subunit